jgi:hypothetical protein
MFKKLRFYILFFLAVNEFGLCAKDVQIGNVEFNFVAKKIVVNYNIINYKPTERFNMVLYFVSESNDTFKCVSISGDFNRIEGGYGKTITWDFASDYAKINNVNIKAVVQVNSVSDQPGGPSNALLSLLVPGLGDRYVKSPRRSIIKPYYVTIVSYGFIGAGVYNQIVKSYYDSDVKSAVLPANIANFKDKSNQAALYSYIYLGIGAAIWVSDIVWVLSKSEKNGNSKTKLSLTPIVNPYSNGYVALSAKIEF